MADDRTVGVRSAALGLGRHLRRGVGVAYILAVILAGYGFWLLLGSGPWLVAGALAALHLA